ncbi:hypothetical protein MOTT27_02687 [Mycobacterium intracellulare subsp. yongonense]|nr:hypothetical protein MOTT27_02687 [Mycobacterium intracellulare subsp. yongonense]
MGHVPDHHGCGTRIRLHGLHAGHLGDHLLDRDGANSVHTKPGDAHTHPPRRIGYNFQCDVAVKDPSGHLSSLESTTVSGAASSPARSLASATTSATVSRACSAPAPALRSASRTTRMPQAVAMTVAFRNGAFPAALRSASYAATPTTPVATVGTAFTKNPCNTIPSAPFHVMQIVDPSVGSTSVVSAVMTGLKRPSSHCRGRHRPITAVQAGNNLWGQGDFWTHRNQPSTLSAPPQLAIAMNPVLSFQCTGRSRRAHEDRRAGQTDQDQHQDDPLLRGLGAVTVARTQRFGVSRLWTRDRGSAAVHPSRSSGRVDPAEGSPNLGDS